MHESRGYEYGVKHLLAQSSGQLSCVIKNQLQINADEFLKLLTLGAIYFKEHRIQDDVSAIKGDYVRVHQKPRRFPVHLFKNAENLVFENNDFVVINKPSGIPTHATVDNLQENAHFLTENFLKTKLHVTHRLDVATSGLLVFAKTKEFQIFFNDLLFNRKVQKIYRALVAKTYDGPLELTHYMRPSPKAPKFVSLISEPGWAKCHLKILNTQQLQSGKTLLTINLTTGRTHQIRAQLSAMGYPIIGDKSYGSTLIVNPEYESIRLEACFIEFEGLCKKVFRFKLPICSDWEI
jgi:23S rRNA pseudouridine1911/1915/1917 synthase